MPIVTSPTGLFVLWLHILIKHTNNTLNWHIDLHFINGFCVTQAYLEMAQELVFDENILLQTLGMLYCVSVYTFVLIIKFDYDCWICLLIKLNCVIRIWRTKCIVCVYLVYFKRILRSLYVRLIWFQNGSHLKCTCAIIFGSDAATDLILVHRRTDGR